MTETTRRWQTISHLGLWVCVITLAVLQVLNGQGSASQTSPSDDNRSLVLRDIEGRARIVLSTEEPGVSLSFLRADGSRMLALGERAYQPEEAEDLDLSEDDTSPVAITFYDRLNQATISLGIEGDRSSLSLRGPGAVRIPSVHLGVDTKGGPMLQLLGIEPNYSWIAAVNAQGSFNDYTVGGQRLIIGSESEQAFVKFGREYRFPGLSLVSNGSESWLGMGSPVHKVLRLFSIAVSDTGTPTLLPTPR